MRIDLEGRVITRKYVEKTLDGMYRYDMPTDGLPITVETKDLDEATLFNSVEDAGKCLGLTRVVPILVWDEEGDM